MGNPAEKTIRNPNLERLLFEARIAVNKKFYFTQNFRLEALEKCKDVQHCLLLAHFTRSYASLDPRRDSA